MAHAITAAPVAIMTDPAFGIVLNVQSGEERYECHVDTNPIEGLLYCSTHRDGDGGELVVSNRGYIRSVTAEEADTRIVEPKAGYLILFDGRHYSHYVRPLKDATQLRLVVAMNFYIPSSPEALRPRGT